MCKSIIDVSGFLGSIMINEDVFDKAMNYLQDEIVWNLHFAEDK